jgi:hypothetical protein
MDSAPQTLERIREALTHPTEVPTLIDQFAPRTRADALAWGRRRPIWDEYRGHFPDQVIDIACVISRRALREFDLMFNDEGCVVNRISRPVTGEPEKPTDVFRLTIKGEPVEVEYTPDYFGNRGSDHFAFKTPAERGRAHPLSQTGYLSHLVRPEIIGALGGPRVYAERFAEASIRGELADFTGFFEGERPKTKPQRRKRPARVTEKTEQPSPVLGEHTAKIVAENSPIDMDKPPNQRTLFS